jgi:serine protease Do
MLKGFVQAVALLCCVFAAPLYARDLPQFASLVKANSPAVVNISVRQKMSAKKMLPDGLKSPENEELFDELMKRFFDYGGGDGGNNPFDFDTDSRGSGFIYSSDGYIVTNQHVVDGADEVKVKLSDGRELDAKVVGIDDRTDVALLKVDATGLPVLKMGSSQNLEVGEWVLAIGSPFGFDHSATAGIVSAKGRSLPDSNYVPFIQTDVAINPGNSGGPLFNLDGEVVGINSQIYSRSGGFMGLSFAIPMDIAVEVIRQLKAQGHVSRGWIGVYIQELDASLAQSFNMQRPEGALVARVLPNGPAVRVLEPGDVIVSFDGKPVATASDLPPMVGSTPLGRKVGLEILRRGQRQPVSLVVTELPKEDGQEASGNEEQENAAAPMAGVLGMSVSDLDEANRANLGVDTGVRVDQVIGEPARRSGLAAGDVITQLDNTAITSVAQFQQLAAELEQGRTVAVLVQRDGSARFLALKIEANATE